MRTISVRNGHQALPRALQILDEVGVRRDSRNGPVIVIPGPFSIEYQQPCERVIFWKERDANPAFHLYESLHMLAGRNDIAPLARYAKQMMAYSDDGVTQHGAYGKRWRGWFENAIDILMYDQLAIIARRLRENPEDRRCVLQMWDPTHDLDHSGKDVPCNVACTLQRDAAGRLDLVVYNRSNDLIWGALGANLVHMSMMQEYMALWIGCPVGTYHQVSSNSHAYEDKYNELFKLPRPSSAGADRPDPYSQREVYPTALSGSIERVDGLIGMLLTDADRGFIDGSDAESIEEPWARVFYTVLKAHHYWRTLAAPERYAEALSVLNDVPYELVTRDWIVAMQEWVIRRAVAWQTKMDGAK